MKIARVEAIPVALPLAKPIHMTGADVAVSQNVVVRIQTDSGRVGWGECASAPTFSGETQGSIMAAIEGYLVPAVLGEDPMRREALRAAMDRRLSGNNGAKAAVEIALFDLAGKALGAPVYELLGGRSRAAARVFWHLGNADPAADACEAAARARDGFTCFKLKVGTTTVERDIEAALEVRKALGPGCELSADANQAWSVAEAIRFARGAERARLSFLEQPVPMSDLPGMAAVARACAVPVLADEGIWTAQDVLAELTALAAPFAKAAGLKLTVSIEHEREPFETPADDPSVRATFAAARQVTGKDPDTVGMRIVGDANLYVHGAGLPTFYYGPSNETAHADVEWASVARLEGVAKVYALTAAFYCGVVE
jgi:muconate cycloisomerase